jgi:alkylation response protein AidB-like acyl-CoA dehydrogenase
MDLSLTDAQRAFRDEVRAWLQAHVPHEPLPAAVDRAGLEAHRAWEKALCEAGYAAIHWPAAYGGRDADMIDVAIFQEEYARAGAPDRINVLGLGLTGPTLIVHGDDAQRERWLPSILSCDAIWCQGFSEPDAGSDLANVQTMAVLDGEDYVVDGQKVWTSQGPFADWMFALVRTSREGPRHGGLSFLMIDMHTPGVEVRPITQINDAPGFSEVFLTGVRVPATNVVGEVGEGWKVAMTTLGFERGTGLGTHVRFSRDLGHLVELVRALGLEHDARVRDEVAGLYAETEVYRHHMYRTLTTMTERDGKPGPDASVNKLYWSEMEGRIFDTGMRLLGASAELAAASPAVAERLGPRVAAVWRDWHKRYWYSRAATIYAGTSEIQKNIIAERVLGLPRGMRG